MPLTKHTDKLQKFPLFVADLRARRAPSFDVIQC